LKRRTNGRKRLLHTKIGVGTANFRSHKQSHLWDPCGIRRGSGDYKCSSTWNYSKHVKNLCDSVPENGASKECLHWVDGRYFEHLLRTDWK